MPAQRTVVTELSTAVGMLGSETLPEALERKPDAMADLDAATWWSLRLAWDKGENSQLFRSGFDNGRAFLHAEDALRGRIPRILEWTGGRRPPGDEVVPSDLRVDHVYLVSCKYLSRILHNSSPARLVEALLTHLPVDDLTDWYQRVAPVEYQWLYEVCRKEVGHTRLPEKASELDKAGRRELAQALRGEWPGAASDAYASMCEVVSKQSARLWTLRLNAENVVSMLWRILRIGSAPYFVLGSDRRGSMRLRVDTPWDWRRRYKLRMFDVSPQAGGQPRVAWFAAYDDRRSGLTGHVHGHVEIRWSHGRFGQKPEAKVYLDVDHDSVPGYHAL